MAFPCRELLLLLTVLSLSLEAGGQGNPYGGGPAAGCTSLITAINARYFASSSSDGPGNPVINSSDYWCAEYINESQYLTVDFGFVSRFDRLLVQGKPDSGKSVSSYFVLTSIDGVNYSHILGSNARPYDFRGPLNDGETVVDSNLTTPVQARYVTFNPREPMTVDENYLCMRVGVESCQMVPSAVHGQWSQWSSYGPCTVPCFGEKSRTRSCTDPAPVFGGQPCSGINKEDAKCLDCVGAVDGAWSRWGQWSTCSTTCGPGNVTRTRTCTDPPPSSGGADCAGSPIDYSSCQLRFCPVHGGWSAWSQPSRCSRSCGVGTQVRSRTCSNPFPSHTGRDCVGDRVITNQCNLRCCPVPGGFSVWGAWSNCPVTCGTGSQTRNRVCNSPVPRCNGNDCVGSAQETKQCSTSPCPRDGVWTQWTTWTQCSQSCDGVRTRSRTCDPPAFGGRDCPGLANESQVCNVGVCNGIVHGGWSSWGVWGVCSASCHPGGIRYRHRTCTNPPPAKGGNNCTGSSSTSEQCNTQPCPIHGNYTEWTQWTACTVSCGGGTRTRERYCTNPAPAYGGNRCQGPNSEIDTCNTTGCPVDGNWSNWTDWTVCSVSCGLGKEYRSRACDNPAPENNGLNCFGSDMDSRDCTPGPCPVDGQWSDWTYTACSATCGQGTRTRIRTCTNPRPSNKGEYCLGPESEKNLDCNNGPCPTQPTGPTTTPPTTTPPLVPAPNITELDVVFALSATSGNSLQTYNAMRSTINRFIDTYGSDKVHYSMIVYGSQLQRVINFNHTYPPSMDELKMAINRQAARSGPSVLRSALQETRRIFNEIPARPNAKKVLVVFTDSNSPSDNKTTLTDAVRPLEDNKTLVISVRVGTGNVGREELLVISPNPLDVLSVQPNIDSGVLSERIMDRILRRDIPLIDIGFGLSATSSASQSIFTLMKNTIKTIIERYGVGRVKFSVIVYGGVVTAQLRDFTIDYTQDELINAVNSLQPIPENKNLAAALAQAEFIFRTNARVNAKKVFVVLTDRVSTVVNPNELVIETAKLRRRDVLILSVGIGSQSTQIGNQMSSVVFAPRDHISVPNYPSERVVVLAETIMTKALEANVPLIDLTFALSANSVSNQATFALMKKTIQNLIQTYGIDRIHYSVIVFGSVAIRHIHFSSNIPDQDELLREVSVLPRSPGSPDLVKALEKAKEVFEDQQVRPNAKKVLVVIMDDASVGNENDLNQVVEALTNQSVLIIGVGVGSSTNPKDLEIITEEKRNVLQVTIVKNPDELAKEIMEIILRTSGLSDWTNWSTCSKSCRYLGEAGTRRRTRFCEIEELGCDGPLEEFRECNNNDCPGCGQRGPLNESDYTASSGETPASLAALDTSDPSASQLAWCRNANDNDGYIQLNLGEEIRIYKVATKGEQQPGTSWVTSYYLSFSVDGQSFSRYTGAQELPGNTDGKTVVSNDVNTTTAYQYVRFHPVSFQGQPCMQAAVFGCREENVLPPARPVASQADAGQGILIALWILAGILTFLLLMACCYYCCWHVCCGRGKKKRGLIYRDPSIEDDGYLIGDEKRWTLGSTATPPRVPEDEVQEVTIEMAEDNAQPLGVIQFGIETDETKEEHVTAEDVKSEKPTYSKDVGTIKSGSTMMRMSASDKATERRKRIKSEGDAIEGANGGADWSYFDQEQLQQGAAFTNDAFMKSQEEFAEPPGSASLRGPKQNMRRSMSADELATIDYDLFDDRRGSLHTATLGRDGYMRMQRRGRGSAERNDEEFEMGTVDVAIAGIRVPERSEDDPSHIYHMAEREISFTADNGGRSVYPLEDGGYRTEEWYTRGGSGPGQLSEEGFQEIQVEHHPIYSEITFGEEEYAPDRV